MSEKKQFITVSVMVAIVGTALFWIVLKVLPPPQNDPLFSGPPQFVVLSLILGLGLYLREVNLRALDMRDKIRDGEIFKTSAEKKHAKKKEEQLQRTSATIMFVSPFLIAFILFLGTRIVVDDLSRFFYDAKHLPRRLYAFDIVVALGLFATLGGLSVAHFRARIQDAEIRELIREEQERESKVQSNSAQQDE